MATRVERLAFILSANSAKLVSQLDKAGKSILGLEKQSTKSVRTIEKNFAALDRRIGGAVDGLRRRVLGLQTAITGLAAGAGAAAPIRFSSQFQKALANVDTLLVDAAVGVERYEKQLLKLAQASSKELIDLTQGLYQTISAGIPAVEGAGGAFDVLEKAQRAAVAGLATTEQSVDAFTTILNAYRDSALSATQVSDLLFTTVRRGKTTFPELASSVGRVATVASKAGVGIDEMLAALASLTKAGLSTDEAVTALRSTILGVLKPTDRARKLFKDLAIPIGENALKGGGLAGVLANISNATGDSADAIVELIPNIRALVGSLALGSNGAEVLREDLAALRNSTGATDVAYAKIAKTFSDTAAIFKSQVQAVFITAGNRVLPRVQAALKRLGDFVVENQDRIGEAFESFVDTLFKIGSFIVENGGKIAKFFLSFFVVGKIVAATLALQKFAAALAATVAAANAGAGAGAAFMTGFQKAIKGLPALISGVLRSPSALGLFVGAALVIGDIIGDAIAKEAEKAVEAAQKELAALQKRAADTAKRLGFSSTEAALEERAAADRGERVVLGKFSRETSLTPEQALDKLEGEGLSIQEAQARVRAEAAEETTRLQKRADEAAKQADALAAQQLRSVQTLAGLRNRASEQADRLRRQIENDSNQLAALRRREQELREGAGRIGELTELAIGDRENQRIVADIEDERAKAASRRANAAAAAARAGQEEAERRERAERARIKLIDEAAAAENELLTLRVEADSANFETRRQQVEAIATLEALRLAEQNAAELQALRDAGAEASEIVEARARQQDALDTAAIAAAEARLDLLRQEEQLAGESADARVRQLEAEADTAIAVAQREGEALAAEFAKGSAARVSVEQATADRIRQIREKLAADTGAIEAEAAGKVATIQVAAAEQQAQALAAQRKIDDRDFKRLQKESAESFLGTVIQGAQAADELLLAGAVKLGEALVSAASLAADVFVDSIAGPAADALSAPINTLLGGLGSAVGALLDVDSFGGEAIRNAESAIEDATADALALAERVSAALPDLVQSAIQAITEALPTIVASVAETAGEVLRVIGEELGDLLTATISSLVDAAPVIIDALVDAVPAIVEALFAAVTQILGALPSLITTLLDGIVALITGLFATLSTQLGPLITNLISGVLGSITAIVRALPALVGEIVFGIVEAISGIVEALPDIVSALLEELPRLVVALIGVLPRIAIGFVDAIVRALPRLLDAIPEALQGILEDAIPALLEGIGDALIALFDGALFESLIEAIPLLIGSIILLIPRLVGSIVTGIGSLFENLFGRLREFFTTEFMTVLGEALLDLIVALGEIILDGVAELGRGVAGEGGFFDALTGGKPDGVLGQTGAFIGRTTGVSAVGKLVRGELPDVEDIPVIGGIVGLFHKGGMISESMRNPLTAFAMRAAGAPAFQAGGMVGRLNSALRAQLGASVADDVPAVLQAGEGVLSRVGVAAAGGAQAVAELNRGNALSPTILQPVIQADDAATEALARMLISRWSLEAVTPGSAVNSTLEQRDPFAGINMVRGRRT